MSTEVLLALADRCEWEPPSQDLDECIWSNIAGEDFAYETTTAYTTSLDAAVTLVPEGWVFSLNTFPASASAYVMDASSRIIRPNQQYIATPALALCAAALRARAAMMVLPPAQG